MGIHKAVITYRYDSAVGAFHRRMLQKNHCILTCTCNFAAVTTPVWIHGGQMCAIDLRHHSRIIALVA